MAGQRRKVVPAGSSTGLTHTSEPIPDYARPSPSEEPPGGLKGLWAKFRSWPIGAQIAGWVVAAFVGLALLGAVLPAPDEDTADVEASSSETTGAPASSTTADETTTTSTTTSTTTTTTTTQPPPTSRPGPEEIPFEARTEFDDQADVLAGGYDVCQQFVEQRLTSPATAEYPDFYEDDGEVTVWRLPDGDYRYLSQVDSENGFGAMLRSFFDCRVDYVGDNEWRLENLTLI